MSKITPKNLHYDSSLPPFLARMQAGQAERGGRHEFDVARPRKQRDAGADAEDEPVYFDEETGESLTKGEWEEKEKEREEEGKEDGKGGEEEKRIGKQNMAVIGGTIKKKRKMGKVIGGGEEDEEENEGKYGRDLSKEKKKSDDQSKKPDTAKPKKKGKKIKLSFGDDE